MKWQTRSTAVLGAALVMGLVAGCGGPDAPATGDRAGKEGAPTARKGPAWTGKAIPGLAAEASWSLSSEEAGSCPGYAGTVSNGRAEDERCVVGDASALVVEEPRKEGATGTRFTVRLRDLKTGTVRKKLTVRVAADPGDTADSAGTTAAEHVQVGEWKDGSPALLVRSRVHTPADGLEKERLRSVFTMYDPSGRKLGSSAFDDDAYDGLPVRRGYLVADGDGDGDDRKYVPIGAGKTVGTALKGETELGTRIDAGFGVSISSDVSYQPSAEWLVATDARTGKKLWSTEELEPPAAIREQLDEETGTSSWIAPLQEGRAVLGWSVYAEESRGGVLTIIDAKTGRRLTEGPASDYSTGTDDDAAAVSPDGRTVVTQYGEGAVAWDTGSGKELWRQAEGEQNIRPVALPGNGVLYAELDESGPAALRMRDKKLLRTGIEKLPEFSRNGYAVVNAGNGFFVFATQHAERTPRT
ncbi:outer membrane protein assembly factor BamB family protein [Streptomyces purpurogeneiscleroticus]|uniref:outer membrane protein assembly factor BamB family protein n=1 Tax=Streptomyces purpurogeneiscleroticus TaxID=68259 RepID=UPI001CC12393|nr:PQQ-binding-like beta-propeller repeat protein [Streptomyces purpurogeneiscleroticus]